MRHNIKLLSTVALDQRYIDNAAAFNIVLDAIPFIRIVPLKDNIAELNDLQRRTLTVVFTSANAVHLAVDIIGNKKTDWTIYCTGGATKEAVLKYCEAGQIAGSTNDASSLAKVIKDDGINEIVFFCGDKRMDTLPEQLREAGVKVKEALIYTTQETSHKVTEQYDGVLFFSPSGVSSFFSLNNVTSDAVLFAVGNTTAGAIRERCSNLVIVGENPSKELLVKEAINYFHKKAIAVHDTNERT